MDRQSLQNALAGLPVAGLRYFNSTGSTNDVALGWAAEGAPDMALVVANQQTAGRGRLDRRWLSRPGSSLIFSLVLHPLPAEARLPGLFSPLGAMALSSTLQNDYGLQSVVKWPNDVLVDGKKIAGVLAESVWQGGVLSAVVVGIGVNVTPASLPPQAGLNLPAACLEGLLGRPVDRQALLVSLLTSLLEWRRLLPEAAFLQAWEQRLAFKGQMVQGEKDGATRVSGRVLGLNPGGSLRLQLEDGTEIAIEAGDVRLRPIEPGR